MTNLRLSLVKKVAAALAVMLIAGVGVAEAQLDRNVDALKMRPAKARVVAADDDWEVNNSAGGLVPLGPPGPYSTHYSWRDNFSNIWRPQNGGPGWPTAANAPLTLKTGDEDWFLIFWAPAGVMHFRLQQLDNIQERIAVEFYLFTAGSSPTLLAGPTNPAPFYREFSKSNNPADPYDGVAMDIPINSADSYAVRIFEKSGVGTFPAGSQTQPFFVRYEFSYECTWDASHQHPNGSNLDLLEGSGSANAPLNNFFESATDITPPTAAPQNFSCQYNGYDYYKVVLTAPGAISVNLNFTPTSGPTDQLPAPNQFTCRFNYELYWCSYDPAPKPDTDEGPFGFIPNPMVQHRVEFEGSDSFNPNTGQWVRVTNPASNMSISTPTLGAGTYYFLVVCFDSGNTPPASNSALLVINGIFGSTSQWVAYYPTTVGTDPPSYNLSVQVVTAADDQYDTPPNSNNTPQAAATLLNGYYPNLRLFWSQPNIQEDWFRVMLNDGDSLEVRLDVNVQGAQADDFDLELYRPATGNNALGHPADRIDRSSADQRGDRRRPFKNASGSVSGRTPYECVGTWGTVGLVGNTRDRSGHYYIRVMAGPVGDIYSDVTAISGTYNLSIFVNGQADGIYNPIITPISVAPDDDRESNDSLAEARLNPSSSGYDGLNRNMRAMDFQDWYVVPVAKNDIVEATLVYTAEAPMLIDAGQQFYHPGVDLDLLMYDIDDLPNNLCPMISAQLSIDAPGQRRVSLSGVAGQGYSALPMVNGQPVPSPSNGNMYIVVQRWGCRGARYDLNINVNGRAPISALELVAVRVSAPPVIDAGLNQFVDVQVDVTNVLTTSETVTGMTFELIHEKGADVTGQYAIIGPAITESPIPSIVTPGTTKTFEYRIQGNPLSTNGPVFVFPHAMAGTKGVPGLPYDDFTTVNGNPPGPKFQYTVLRAAPGSNLKPGGGLVLEVVVSNGAGTTGGMLTAPSSIVFTRTGLDVTSEYTLTSNSPVVGGVANGLPHMLTVGQEVYIEWVYGISSGATEGPVVVTFTGGGTDNPEIGSGTFTIAGGYGQGFIGGAGGSICSAPAEGFSLPWLLVGSLFLLAVAAVRRRRTA